MLGTRHGPALSSCKSMGRHCADNNAGAQKGTFFRVVFRYLATAALGRWHPVGGAIRSREDHSDEKITHHEVGWSPPETTHNVRGGQASDWKESQMLAALAVSELPAALQ